MFKHTKCIATVATMWFDAASPQFVNSLAQLLVFSQRELCGPDEFIQYINAPMSYHQLARDWIAENSLGPVVFCLDTDHQFSPDLLVRLWRAKQRNKSRVISGMYMYKTPPHGPVANLRKPDGGTEALLTWDPTQEVIPVGHVGGGCLLIDISVFNEIGRKMNGESPFGDITGLSEDYAFCERCYRLGIPVHLAPNIESHHLAPRHALHVGDWQKGQGK